MPKQTIFADPAVTHNWMQITDIEHLAKKLKGVSITTRRTLIKGVESGEIEAFLDHKAELRFRLKGSIEVIKW